MTVVELKQILESHFNIFLNVQDVKNATFGKILELQNESKTAKSVKTANGMNYLGWSKSSVMVRSHYAAWENATRRVMVRSRYAAWENATWQKLLGICHKIDHFHIKKEFFANYISVYNCGMRNMYATYATPKITFTLLLTGNIGAANLWLYWHFANRIFMPHSILQHVAACKSRAKAVPHWCLHYFWHLSCRGKATLCCILPCGIVWKHLY